jgi:uncharacterized protein (DUF697 family)
VNDTASGPTIVDPITPDARVARMVHGTSMFAAVVAAVLSPIPLADELVFLPTHAVLALRIGKARGLAVRDVPWRPIVATSAAGLAARGTINLTVSFVPGVAAVANALSAIALTEIIGTHIDDACRDPAHAHPLTPKEIVDKLKEKVDALRAKWAARRQTA